MLYKGLRTLNKLNTIKELKRVIIAKIIIFINNFDFSKILLNSIKAEAF
jgi:hypothetical protein